MRLFLAWLLLLAAQLQAKTWSVLATGDMHGWLQPQRHGAVSVGGAAEMLAAWREREGLDKAKMLVLSAGDIATGPAIGTAFKGESVVEAMNLMGYDASALGNHEFDFGLEQLRKLKAMASFPILCANLLEPDGSPSALVPATAVIDRLGFKLGIIGLVTRDLDQVADSRGMRAEGYEAPLRRAAAELKGQGAQAAIVLAHVAMQELLRLAQAVPDLEIPLMLGGHSHELAQAQARGGATWVVSSGENWRAYSRVDLDFDEASGRTKVLASRQVRLEGLNPPADPAVAASVAAWDAKLGKDLRGALGYTESGLPLFWPLANLVCDAWLDMDRKSDVALINKGGLRQAFDPGPLLRKDLLGLLPFDNKMVRIKLSGAVLKQYLEDKKPGSAGLKKPLDDSKIYNVLLNNYMYNTNQALKKADPAPSVVWHDWREPVERWLKKKRSSPKRPLESLVDPAPRGD